jgi:hypothetical protein
MMGARILYYARTVFTAVALFSAIGMGAQTTVSSEKDITRPEIKRQFDSAPAIQLFSVERNNGYNDIRWNGRNEQQAGKYIIEYSGNGVYFQSAGEAMVRTGTYLYKHYTTEINPLLYRIKIVMLDGKTYYSQNFLVDGIASSPVKLYPTVITGNTVNIRSYFPVQRITVLSGNGQQVYTKDVNGNTEDMNIVLPNLGKGIYFVHVMGKDWKSTERIIVQ